MLPKSPNTFKIAKYKSVASIQALKPVKPTPIFRAPVGLATSFGLLVTVMTLGLTLLGYGYELSYLATFDLLPEEL